MTTQQFEIFNKASENMSEVANGSIDLVVMDPPYAIGLKYEGKSDEKPLGNYLDLVDRVVSETARVLNPRGIAVIPLPSLVRKQGVNYNYPAIYSLFCARTGLGLLDHFYFRVTEEGDASCVPISKIEDPQTPANCHSQEMRGIVLSKSMLEVRPFPVERTYNYVQRETHPCPFPAELVKDILDTYFKPGDKVLEPFMGTGSLGAEVIRRGGAYRGYETEPAYFKIAQEKLKAAEEKMIKPKLRPVEDRPSPLWVDQERERLVSRMNSGGGWYNGDENSARIELEEHDAWKYRTEHDTD